MFVTVKYVGNSQKNWDNIKSQKQKKQKKIKAFKKKPAASLPKFIICKIIYVIIPFVIIIVSTWL